MKIQVDENAGGRLRQIRQNLGITGSDVADALGVSKAAISHWESGRAALPMTACLALSYLYGVPYEWLATGEGPKALWRVQSEVPNSTAIGEDPEIYYVPLLEGTGTFSPHGIAIHPGNDRVWKFPILKRELESVPIRMISGGVDGLLALTQEGNSMSPLLLDGDVVLITTGLVFRENPVNDDIYLVRRYVTDQKPRFRKLRCNHDKQQLTFMKADSDAKIVTVDITEGTISKLVLGRVLWIGRWLDFRQSRDDEWD